MFSSSKSIIVGRWSNERKVWMLGKYCNIDRFQYFKYRLRVWVFKTSLTQVLVVFKYSLHLLTYTLRQMPMMLIYLVQLTMIFVICEREAVHPRLLVEVHQHSLLQFVLAVVDGDGVIVTIQPVNQGLDWRLLKVTKNRCGLSENNDKDVSNLD